MTDSTCACHLGAEVRSLRADVDALKQELHDLREQMDRDQPDVSRTAISSIQIREWWAS